MTEENKLHDRLHERNRVLKETHAKWASNPATACYLEGIPKKHQEGAALILENQRLMSEASNCAPEFYENSLLLVQKVLTGFHLLDMVGFQPMFGPASYLFYLNFKYGSKDWTGDLSEVESGANAPEVNLVIETEEAAARTRKLRIEPSTFKEEGWLDKLADDIRNDITREIITDLRNNVGTVAAWDANVALGKTIKERYEDLYIKIVEVSSVIHRKTLRGGANWIVAGKEISGLLQSSSSAPFHETKHLSYWGTMCNRWRTYFDPDLAPNEILLGYMGDSGMDSGYFYNPYVFLWPTPTTEEGPPYGILARYSKKLLKSGSKFYAKLTVANLTESLS